MAKEKAASAKKSNGAVVSDIRVTDSKGNQLDVQEVTDLVITSEKPAKVKSNVEQMRLYLEFVTNKYSKMQFTTANLPEVTKTKAAMRSLRVAVEKSEKEVKNVFFDAPKKAFIADVAPLYSLIANIENKCDDVLEQEDQKRIDGINKAIDAYIEEFTAEDSLGQLYMDKFERKKMYYNKTQDETDTRNDIQAQIIALQKMQKAYEKSKAAIQKACAKNKLINELTYIKMLNDDEDLATILEAIEEELERLENVKQVQQSNAETSATQGQEYAVQYTEDDTDYTEAAEGVDFTSDLPERTKTVLVEITYPADASKALSELFAMLWTKGIKSKIVSGGE